MLLALAVFSLSLATADATSHVALGGNIAGNAYHTWEPTTTSWVTGNAQGYSEGEAAAFYVEYDGVAGEKFFFHACFEYFDSGGGGAYAFINLVDYNTTYSPTILGTALDAAVSGVSADADATIDLVTYIGVDTTPCETGTVGWKIEFTVDVTTSSGYIYYGAELAEPGAVTVAGTTVPAGQGVSDWHPGTFQAFLKDVTGNRTVNFQPSAIEARADLSFVTTCPDFFAAGPYTYEAITTNAGASPSSNTELVYTLPAGVTYTGFTSTPTATCSAAGQVITCNLSSLPVGDSWTVGLEVTLNSGTSGTLQGSGIVSSDETDPDTSDNTDVCTSTTPVVVSYFSAENTSQGAIEITWRSESESDIVGYNVLAQTEEGLVVLNDEPILAALGTGAEAFNDYSFRAANIGATAFHLEALHGDGMNLADGPFFLGRPEGRLESQPAVPWATIREEHDALASVRLAQLTMDASSRIDAWQDVAAEQQILGLSPGDHALFAGAGDTEPPAVTMLELLVDTDGIQRITFEQLAAAGFNMMGLPSADLAMTVGGQPIPIRVASGPFFGPGAFIEWVGEAAHSLYTSDNVYRLHLDAALAQRVTVSTTPPSGTGSIAPAYMETAELEQDSLYRLWSSNPQDPWLATDMLVFGSPRTWSYSLDIDAFVPGAATPQLEVELMGFTRLAPDPDHHIVADVNGTMVADITFDDAVRHVALADLPAGLLAEGANTVNLTNPADLGVPYDYTGLDSIRVRYPRAFVARDGVLSYASEAQAFMVMGFTSPDVVVYQRDAVGMTRITGVGIMAMGGGQYGARFDGSGAKGEFWISESDATHTPDIRPARADAGIDQGTAQVLVVSHADFIAGLSPWVQARQAQGFQVRVVDIADVIDRFGHGVYGVDGLRDYIRFAAAEMGTESVLLVGSDSYDYHGYLGSGAISFVPTVYAETDPQTKFAPADPLLGDLDDDGVPEIAIGRWPVRTAAQLSDVVAKTLLYDDSAQPREAVFAADVKEDYANFSSDSDGMQAALPGTWSGDRAHIDTLGAGGARSLLLSKLNLGMRLASFVGHSSSRSWTRSGLLSATDAMNLQNSGRPTAILQWGCWNTYYVNPSFDSMAHRFLLTNDRGAALVLGATTITRADSERELGEELMPRLMTPGQTVGQAIIGAKQALDARLPGRVDVQAGWALLGDPTVIIEH